MTASNRPRLSLTGVGLAGALFATSWLLTPAPASAADDKTTGSVTSASPLVATIKTCDHNGQCTKECAKTHGAVTYTIATPQPTDVIAGQATTPANGNVIYSYTTPQSGSTVYSAPTLPPGAYVLQPGAAASPLTTSGAYTVLDGQLTTPVIDLQGGGALRLAQAQSGGDENMDELRERLAKLESELQALSKSLGDRATRSRDAAPRAAGAGGGRGGAPGGSLGGGGGRAAAAPTQALRALAGASGGAVEIRTYKISNAAKAKALGDLMIREDVPIRVSPKESAIEVHGTPAQHEVFKAFLDMIEGKSGGGGSGMNISGTRALLGAANKADFEKRSAEAAKELAAAYGANASKMSKAGAELAKSYAANAERYQQQLQELISSQTAHVTDAAVREKVAEALARVDGSKQSVQDALMQLRTHARAGQSEATTIRREAEALERQAQGMERQIERLREQAEKLREKARSMNGDKGESREHEADSMEHTADATAAEKDMLLAQADEITTRADQVENMADVIDSTADTIEEFLDRAAEESEVSDELDVDSIEIEDAEEAAAAISLQPVAAACNSVAPVAAVSAVAAPAPISAPTPVRVEAPVESAGPR